MTVVRLGPTGGLDPSFGQSGIATVNVTAGGNTTELARGVVVQSGGKVVMPDQSSTIRLRLGTRHGIPTLLSSGSMPQGN